MNVHLFFWKHNDTYAAYSSSWVPETSGDALYKSEWFESRSELAWPWIMNVLKNSNKTARKKQGGRNMQYHCLQDLETDVALNEDFLLSLSERFAATFDRFNVQASCPCGVCRSTLPGSSNTANVTHGRNLPPPSRYIRRAGYVSSPPKGPTCCTQSSMSPSAGPIESIEHVASISASW